MVGQNGRTGFNGTSIRGVNGAKLANDAERLKVRLRWVHSNLCRRLGSASIVIRPCLRKESTPQS